MITKDKLAEAVRSADNIVDSGTSTEDILRLRGIDPKAALYVAEQRALRVVLAARGSLGQMDPTKMSRVSLSEGDQYLVKHLMSVWLDGLLAGVKCGSAEATLMMNDGKHRERG